MGKSSSEEKKKIKTKSNKYFFYYNSSNMTMKTLGNRTLKKLNFPTTPVSEVHRGAMER